VALSLSLIMVGLPHVRVRVLFYRLENCVRGGGIFLMLQKYPGFWPLLIVTLSFSVVITYVTVRNTCRQRFNLRTCSQSLPVDPNACSHSPVPVVHVEFCAAQWRTCCALFSSCVAFIALLRWEKESLNSRTKNKYSYFRNGRDEWEAECLVCKPGT
jgi:hypothetical protein